MYHTEFCVNLAYGLTSPFLSGCCQLCVPYSTLYCAFQNLTTCYLIIGADLRCLFLCMDSRDKGRSIDVAHLF